MTSTQPATHKAIFDICAGKSLKLAVKHSIEKPILLNFVNLTAILCPGLYDGFFFAKVVAQKIFITDVRQDPEYASYCAVENLLKCNLTLSQIL